MTVIETSRLLLECADWLEGVQFQIECSIETKKSFDDWAAAIRSIAIPEPGEMDSDIVELLP